MGIKFKSDQEFKDAMDAVMSLIARTRTSGPGSAMQTFRSASTSTTWSWF